MSQHLDVFVSSTSEDLTDHRAAVRQAVESLGLNPIMMEDFPAEGAKPIDVCKRNIADSEMLVGIYAHRHGWIPSADCTSPELMGQKSTRNKGDSYLH
jgi:hypothetical protein